MIARARFAAAACLLAGCVLNPESHTLINGGANVTFTGRTVALDGLRLFLPLRVFVDYQDKSGAFIEIGSSLVPSDGWFAVTASVPEGAYWGTPCGLATFRVRDSFGATYTALDRECLDNPPSPGASCTTNLIVLQRRVTFAGDLVLQGQSEADAHQCLNTVEGNLTIVGGRTVTTPGFFAPGLSFSLPQLREVTGNLNVDGDRTEQLELPALRSVGGNLQVTLNSFETLVGTSTHTFTLNAIDAPRLASVGGGVDLLTAKFASGGFNPTYNFAMPALTAVGTGVTIHNPVFPGRVAGLPGLTSIPGDLLFDYGTSDLNSVDDPTTAAHEGLLPLLASVGGNADLVLPFNANFALGSLRTVGGTLTVRATMSFTTLRPTIVPLLSAVGADMVLNQVRFPCSTDPRWPSLEQIGGTLKLDQAGFEQPFGATGATHLSLAGLLMDATSSAQIPLQADVVVRGAGAVSFTNNANLCPCEIQAFAAGLTSRGWSGTATESGNGTAATCTPCPVPASCP
jgi:hypothetical protein